MPKHRVFHQIRITVLPGPVGKTPYIPIGKQSNNVYLCMFNYLKTNIMKRVIATPDAPKAVGPYSQAIEVNGTLYISGQIPVNPADGKVQEDIVAAAHQSLKNIGAILKEAGMTYDNVVKTTVLLADIADFKAVNEVYAEYFTGDKPARACYQAAALPLGVKVEIEAIAVK